jgi:hypothetical protein
MIATLENTVFYSVAAYAAPGMITAPLRQTAEHFGIFMRTHFYPSMPDTRFL